MSSSRDTKASNANATTAPAKTNGTTKPVSTQSSTRSSAPSSTKTMIKVQSLKSNSPRMTDVEHDSANNDATNRLSFGEKKNIVSTALPLSQSANSLETMSLRSPVDSQPKTLVNGKDNGDITSKSNTKINKTVDSAARTGPLEQQSAKVISRSADNVSRPEVVKSGVKPTKPAARVVMNADKQMIDLDSFTERKNMLSELKNFDKQLKPIQASKAVTEVKLGFGKENGDSGKDMDTDPGDKEGKANSRSAFLNDIKQAKKPSEVKEPKQAVKPSEVKNIQKVSSDKQEKLFDDILKGVDSGSESSESANDSPRDDKPVNQTNDSFKIEIKSLDKNEDVAKDYPSNSHKDVAPVSEVSYMAARNVTTIQEENEDTDENESEEDDRFVSEFQFPGKSANAQAAAVPKMATKNGSK